MLEQFGLLQSGIRTVVPYLVGYIVSFFALAGVVLPDTALDTLSGLITLTVGTIYYLLVRIVGKKLPGVEWLLGSPKKPEYK